MKNTCLIYTVFQVLKVLPTKSCKKAYLLFVLEQAGESILQIVNSDIISRYSKF